MIIPLKINPICPHCKSCNSEHKKQNTYNYETDICKKCGSAFNIVRPEGILNPSPTISYENNN